MKIEFSLTGHFRNDKIFSIYSGAIQYDNGHISRFRNVLLF